MFYDYEARLVMGSSLCCLTTPSLCFGNACLWPVDDIKESLKLVFLKKFWLKLVDINLKTLALNALVFQSS